MRISSKSLQLEWLASFGRQQARVAELQRQIGSGQRVATAADDPVGAGQIVRLDSSVARLETYAANAETARRRLALEENTLEKVNDALTRVRELAVQSGTGIQSEQDRAAIAGEVNELLTGLLGLSNAQDGEGRYLFAGNAVKVQPFVRQGDTFIYQGDAGVRVQRISDQRTVEENHSGSDVFRGLRGGNGTFTVGVGAGNQGTAFWKATSVTNPAAFTPDIYTISFPSTTTFQVATSGGTVVATGAYAAGSTISFNGVGVTLDGAPAAGDTFVITPSTTQSIFDSVRSFASSLTTALRSPADRARFQSDLNTTLQDLDQAQSRISVIRSETGARLQAIDEQLDNNAELGLQLKESLASVRDLDYASAISELERQLASLEAAQKSFARTRTFSLFDIL